MRDERYASFITHDAEGPSTAVKRRHPRPRPYSPPVYARGKVRRRRPRRRAGPAGGPGSGRRGAGTEDEGVAEEDEPGQVPLRRRRVAEARPEHARLPRLAQQHQPALPVRVQLPPRPVRRSCRAAQQVKVARETRGSPVRVQLPSRVNRWTREAKSRHEQSWRRGRGDGRWRCGTRESRERRERARVRGCVCVYV